MLKSYTPASIPLYVLRLGADVVGLNCNFGPNMLLKAMRLMKEGLDKEGLKTPLICQPIGFFTPEVDCGDGYLELPEHFLGKHYVTERYCIYIIICSLLQNRVHGYAT